MRCEGGELCFFPPAPTPHTQRLTFFEKGEKDQANMMTGCFLIRAPSSAWTASASEEPAGVS